MFLALVDWQPIITAVAGLIVALTPAAVAGLSIWISRVDTKHTRVQNSINDRLDELPQKTAEAVQPGIDQAARDIGERRGRTP